MNSTDAVFKGFGDDVLERWGLKPAAKDTLMRAKEKGVITTQEISGMISAALVKDRAKMTEVMRELKETLRSLNINVTVNVVHHHQPTVETPAPTAAPTPKSELSKPQQPGEKSESPFLNGKILQQWGLLPEALEILLAAKTKGIISPQQIGALIPAEISRDKERLRPIMRWITQLLTAANIKIVIGGTQSPPTTPRKMEVAPTTSPAPSNAPSKLAVLFNSTGISGDEPSKKSLVEVEIEEDAESPLDGDGLGNDEFVPKFIFDREDGAVINPYYRAAKNHKFLKHEDLLELSRRWHRDGDYEARNTIVVHNLRLAMKIAAHYMGRGLDYDDLVQEGNIGLITAAERFDPEKGFRFTTYATWWVRQGISRGIQNMRDTIRIPVHANEALSKVMKVMCELAAELQREPMVEEIAARANEEIDQVKKVLRQYKIPMTSLEDLAYKDTGHNSEATVGDMIMDQNFPSPNLALEAKEDLERARVSICTFLGVLKALGVPDRHKTAFKMYYGLEGHDEDHTLETIGQAFGVSRERIRQMNVIVWQRIAEHGIAMNDEKLVADLRRVRDLENIVCAEADLSTPIEDIILKEVSTVFQDAGNANTGETVPGVTITSQRPEANLTEVTPGAPTQEDIIRVVADVYGIRAEAILGEAKTDDLVWARQVCAYIMREKLKSSFVKIGHTLHYADHTTARYGYRAVKADAKKNPAVSEKIEKIIVLCGFRKEETAAKEVDADIAMPQTSPIVTHALDILSQVFGTEKSHLFAKSATRPSGEEKLRVLARAVAIHILRADFNVPRQDVSKLFGFADDSRISVICREIAQQMETDTELQAKLVLIRGQYTLEAYGSDFEMLKETQTTLFPKQVEELTKIAEEAQQLFQAKVRRLHDKLVEIDVPERHRECFRSRHSGDITKQMATLEDVGDGLGITRERARQITNRVWKQLVPNLEPDDIHNSDEYAGRLEKILLLVEILTR